MVFGRRRSQQTRVRVDGGSEREEHDTYDDEEAREVERLGLLLDRRDPEATRHAQPDEPLLVRHAERAAVGREEAAEKERAPDEVEPDRDRPGRRGAQQQPEGERRGGRPARQRGGEDGEAPGRGDEHAAIPPPPHARRRGGSRRP